MDDIGKAVNAAGYEVARDEVSLTIGGMHCATCSTTVGDALREVPGVVDAKVNFALGKAVVEYDSPDRLTGPPQEGRREGRVQGPGGRGRPRREDRAPERARRGVQGPHGRRALRGPPRVHIDDLRPVDDGPARHAAQELHPVRARDAGPVLCGVQVLQGGIQGAHEQAVEHGHARRPGDDRRLRLQPARHIPAGRDRLDARVLNTRPPS